MVEKDWDRNYGGPIPRQALRVSSNIWGFSMYQCLLSSNLFLLSSEEDVLCDLNPLKCIRLTLWLGIRSLVVSSRECRVCACKERVL